MVARARRLIPAAVCDGPLVRVSYRLLYVTGRSSPGRVMLPLLPRHPLLCREPVPGSAREAPVSPLAQTGPPSSGGLTLLAGVQAAEVPNDQRLHEQHGEGGDQRGPRAAGQPASARAAEQHPRAGAAGAE